MSTTTRPNARRDRVLDRREIEGLIADGRTIFIANDKVYKADAWLKYHPGGDKAIMHMIGRDATDEVQALHSPEALKRMNAYQIGTIQGPWVNFVPPIQGGTFRTRDAPEEQQHEKCPTLSTEGQDRNHDESSSQPSSAEPSPIFDPADKTALRRRTQNRGNHAKYHSTSSTPMSRSSSNTSMSSLDVGESSVSKGNLYKDTVGDARTRQELEHDLATYPKLDPNTQADIVRKYRLLHERMTAEGLYECHYSSYMIELCRYTFLFTMSMLLLHWGWYCTSACFLGAFWHQLVFTAHDSGHMGITHNFQVDSVIGIIIADFLGGLSLGWWKRNHNVHHIVTNSAEHDPDIQHIPFFAISHRFFDSLRSTYYDRIMTYDPFAKFLIRYQNYLYYPILTFGRFNLYRLSWEYILLGQGPRSGPAAWHRWLELAGQIFFWSWFGYGVVYRCIPTPGARLAFVLISHAVTMPVHVQITLSHFAMSTADLGVAESFPQRMLRTTMDVDCPQWLDFFHGGLQFQAIHHLYPRMPRHNLRRAQKLVQEFCKDVGIPYAIYGFGDGNREVINRLGDVAKQARILAECQRTMVEHGDFGMH